MPDRTPSTEGSPVNAARAARNRFNPSEHLVKLKGKDYLEVRWRIAWLRDEHPDARIRTEMVERGDDYAIFKAHVALPTGGEATGWGSETAGDFKDFLEKGETKSLGRALAALGYGTQFTDEHDFGADQGRVVDAPVERPVRRQPSTGSASAANGGSNLASPAQLKAIYAIASQDLHWSPEQVDEHIYRMTRKRTTELARSEASRVIDSLKQLVVNQ